MKTEVINEVKEETILSRSLILLMASGCGIAVANLYYLQPLLSEIAKSFHVSEVSIGTAAMLTQVGYALGMFFFIPLGDIRERRSLIVTMLCFSAAALLAMSIAFNINIILFTAFAVGFSSVVPQLIVPFAAQLAPDKERGKVVGTVMSGLLIGILLSRTFSGMLGAALSWRAVYIIAAAMMLILAAFLRKYLPVSRPTIKFEYKTLMISLWKLTKTEPELREASITGAMMFATFSAFWTTLVFLLSSKNYNLGAREAGLFGLVGVTGALAAPIVGKLADKKNPKFTFGIALCISTVSYICFLLFGLKLWGLIIGVILLDLGIQSGQISNQTRIYALNPDARNRVNTVFMVTYFIGGSFGSFLGAYSWARYGWSGVCITGLLFQMIAAIVHFKSILFR